MAEILPFRGFRPMRLYAKDVAAPPYDVLDTEEARAMAQGNRVSFLHVSKAEIDFPAGVDPHTDEVYTAGANNLRRLIVEGYLRRDPAPSLYVYRQRMGAHVQTGLMAAVSGAEYEYARIKRHELTRADKEDDRTRHIDATDANTEPVFLTYRRQSAIDEQIAAVCAAPPVADFVADDGIAHTLWVIDDAEQIETLQTALADVPALYIADGHHRSAAAVRVRRLRREQTVPYTGKEPFNYFLAVVFPDNQLQILPYNRVVRNLNGMSPAEFLGKLGENFTVRRADAWQPTEIHTFGLYLDGAWHELRAKPGSFPPDDPVLSLDVQILSDGVLAPLLGITDPRTDKRLDFVGGIRGLGELERLVNSGKYAAAFALYPTTVAQLMAIADAGRIMPPKSTWFEPKLRSGLVVRLLDE
jgi:uncharacterized protein (DUF1015 family)